MARARLVNDLDPRTHALLDKGAAELWRNGQLAGHVTTRLEEGWGAGRPLGAQTFVWLLVTLDDGVRYVIEDYPPYATVPDALAGHLTPENAAESAYDVRWLEGPARERVWRELGIHESFGSYRPEGSQSKDRGWPRLLGRIRRRRR
jgi:hypothetical protein